MSLKMPSNRGESITLIGAVSEQLGTIYMKSIKGSNNQEVFLEFMQELTHKLRGEAILIMDNFTVHHSRMLQDFFTEN